MKRETERERKKRRIGSEREIVKTREREIQKREGDREEGREEER